MAKKNTYTGPKVEHDFMDTCVWAATRYFVGRSTIAAGMFAPELAKFLQFNPEFLSQDRKVFLARDIRERINDTIGWKDNVWISGHNDKIDAFSLICDEIIKMLTEQDIKFIPAYAHKGKASPAGYFDPTEWEWHVDLNTKEVKIKPFITDKTYPNVLDPQALLTDLTTWIKLANWLDPQEVLTYTYDGTTESAQGFHYPSCGRYVDEEDFHFKNLYITCNGYIENPFVDKYIPEVDDIKTI